MDMIKNVGCNAEKNQNVKNHIFLNYLSVKLNRAMKFGVLVIWDVTVTLGPFLKWYISIKEHKDKKVTFCDITILNSQTVSHLML